MQISNHQLHKNNVTAEITRLVGKLPASKHMGIKEADKVRFVAAARQMANFNEEQIKHIIARSQSFINYRLAASRKEDSEAITDWVEDILDASQGYREAHAWTRGSSKAPPLPTHMWRQGKYISHPHEMAGHLLHDWAKIWTQESPKGAPPLTALLSFWVAHKNLKISYVVRAASQAVYRRSRAAHIFLPRSLQVFLSFLPQ